MVVRIFLMSSSCSVSYANLSWLMKSGCSLTFFLSRYFISFPVYLTWPQFLIFTAVTLIIIVITILFIYTAPLAKPPNQSGKELDLFFRRLANWRHDRTQCNNENITSLGSVSSVWWLVLKSSSSRIFLELLPKKRDRPLRNTLWHRAVRACVCAFKE